jgi:hypothetical protein
MTQSSHACARDFGTQPIAESFFEADTLGLFAGLLVLGIAVAAYRIYSSQENAHG